MTKVDVVLEGEPKEIGFFPDDSLPPVSGRRQLVDEIAKLMIAEWERVDEKVNVSRVANFADMAKVVVERLAPEPEIPIFMAGAEFSWIDDLDKQEYVSENVHKPVEGPEDANLISSKVKGKDKHKVILDLDFDAALLPSSTPGHWHLYLDKELARDQMDELLRTLANVGIIAPGNLNQWDKFKAQFLRLPWIKKGEGATKLDEGHDPKE